MGNEKSLIKLSLFNRQTKLGNGMLSIELHGLTQLTSGGGIAL